MNQLVHTEIMVDAPPEVVFDLLADTASWPSWSVMDSAVLERPADGPEPEGVGALRRFETGRVTSREEVVAFERNRRFAYELRSGLPLNDYHAEVTLAPEDGGTRLQWRSTFRAKVPGTGWIYRRGLQKFIATLAGDLARVAAGKRSGSSIG